MMGSKNPVCSSLDAKLQRSGRMADPQDHPNGEPEGAATPPEKVPPAKAAKKAPAKKAPAKKAPAKKAPAKSPEPAPPKATEQPLGVQQRIETNGQLGAAKDVAAQAKSTVEGAPNPVAPAAAPPASGQSPVPLI